MPSVQSASDWFCTTQGMFGDPGGYDTKDLEKDYTRSKDDEIIKFSNIIHGLTSGLRLDLFQLVDFNNAEVNRKISLVSCKISGDIEDHSAKFFGEEIKNLAFLLIRELNNLSEPLIPKEDFIYPSGKLSINLKYYNSSKTNYLFLQLGAVHTLLANINGRNRTRRRLLRNLLGMGRKMKRIDQGQILLDRYLERLREAIYGPDFDQFDAGMKILVGMDDHKIKSDK